MTDMHLTARPTSPFMEQKMGEIDYALDHGFLRVVDYMGTSASVVQAARVSYGEGTKTVREDEGLIRYLLRHHHTTPFEMLELKVHVKLPIFVARQWIRHRTANVNEYSARYSLMSGEFYVPRLEHIQPQSTSNRQGREGGYDEPEAAILQETLRALQDDAFRTYNGLVDDNGYDLSRELARIGLSLGSYTEFYWKIDLHNLLHFLRLRVDSHAQYEIRVYAQILEGIVKNWVPEVHRAWVDYVRDAVTFSRQEMEIIRALAETAENRSAPNFLSDMAKISDIGSAREQREFLTKIGVQ